MVAWTVGGAVIGAIASIPIRSAFPNAASAPGEVTAGLDPWLALLGPALLAAAGAGLALMDRRSSSAACAGLAAGLVYAMLFLEELGPLLTVKLTDWKSLLLFLLVAAVPTALFLAASQATAFLVRLRPAASRAA